MGSGFYATWINSDDMLCKNALTHHSARNRVARGLVYVGDCIHIDENGKGCFTHRGRVESLEDLVRIDRVWRRGGSIDQPAVLFPLELVVRIGGLNEKNHNSMDYELWGKLLLEGAKIHYTGIPFGIFRRHDMQKTADAVKQTESLLRTATALVAQAHSLSSEVKQEILADLESYQGTYAEQHWKHTGRLARMGLPPSIVMPMRTMRATVRRTISRLVGFSKGLE
jgi:hypothetical protein